MQVHHIDSSMNFNYLNKIKHVFLTDQVHIVTGVKQHSNNNTTNIVYTVFLCLKAITSLKYKMGPGELEFFDVLGLHSAHSEQFPFANKAFVNYF